MGRYIRIKSESELPNSFSKINKNFMEPEEAQYYVGNYLPSKMTGYIIKEGNSYSVYIASKDVRNYIDYFRRAE